MDNTETFMKTKATLAVCDLDAAVKALDQEGWDSQTCLIAQFGMRTLDTNEIMGSSHVLVTFKHQVLHVEGASKFVSLFDDTERGHPHNIALIRRQLPIDLEVEIC